MFAKQEYIHIRPGLSGSTGTIAPSSRWREWVVSGPSVSGDRFPMLNVRYGWKADAPLEHQAKRESNGCKAKWQVQWATSAAKKPWRQ